MIKVTIFECDTTDEFDHCIVKLKDKTRTKIEAIEEAETMVYGVSENGEVGSAEFERLMSDKGYKVSTAPAKKTKCKLFKIGCVKRGREWKYSLSDIQRVPVKRGFNKKFGTQSRTQDVD